MALSTSEPRRSAPNPTTPRDAYPLYFLTFPSAKDPSWDERHPGRATIDIGVTSRSLFEPSADTGWMNRGADYDELKARLIEELLDQVFRFCPQLRGKIDHTELATPLGFNHFLGRDRGDFMSLAASPKRFAIRGLGAHSGVPNLFFSEQDVAAAGVVGAVQGGVIAASGGARQERARGPCGSVRVSVAATTADVETTRVRRPAVIEVGVPGGSKAATRPG
ncbi:hypothetical protein [Rhodococcus jostii]|uniref:hypothetical protein n=1 Tax=Rhodococcus jostii TaxID=132919 RepID=UPI0036696A97